MKKKNPIQAKVDHLTFGKKIINIQNTITFEI